MRTFRTIFLLAVVMGAIACYYSSSKLKDGQFVLKPQGEQIKVIDKTGGTLKGEFLFVDEQAVYVLAEGPSEPRPKAVAVAFTRIRELKILSVANRRWLGPVLGFQIAPAILFGATYAVASEGHVGDSALLTATASVPGLVTALILALSKPKTPGLSGEITFEKAKDLLKYARYPFILDPEVKQRILDGLKLPSSPEPIKRP